MNGELSGEGNGGPYGGGLGGTVTMRGSGPPPLSSSLSLDANKSRSILKINIYIHIPFTLF